VGDCGGFWEELGWGCCDVGEGGLEGWGRRWWVGVLLGVAHFMMIF